MEKKTTKKKLLKEAGNIWDSVRTFFTNRIDLPAGDGEPYDITTMEAYDPRHDLQGYRFPTAELLIKYDQHEEQVDLDEQAENQKRIKQTLESFGIDIVSIKATAGPTLTLYEVVPVKDVRVSQVRNSANDIALSLSSFGTRIIVPMPGKGTIGIEMPNKKSQIVSMQSIILSRQFIESKYDLPVVLGRTITQEIFMFDLCYAPNVLIAETAGQGKLAGLNAIITSLLLSKKHPAELKFVLIDSKKLEFSIYSEIECHYLAKVPGEDKTIVTDFSKVAPTLNSLCKEVDDRFELLTKAHTRNIKVYNEQFISRRLNPEKGHKFMPYIVVIIDDFVDLILTAGKDIEIPIVHIARKARALGIHMIIATQRCSTNIIKTIKAYFPVRIAFRVHTLADSLLILDSPGANQLQGRGDLLFSYKGTTMTRVQCAHVDTDEVQNIVSFIGEQAGYPTAFLLPEIDENEDDKTSSEDLSNPDPLFEEAARLTVMHQQISASLIQRTFAIGYIRAGRLMDQLEVAGIIGTFDGTNPRQVLITDEYTLESKLTVFRKNI